MRDAIVDRQTQDVLPGELRAEPVRGGGNGRLDARPRRRPRRDQFGADGGCLRRAIRYLGVGRVAEDRAAKERHLGGSAHVLASLSAWIDDARAAGDDRRRVQHAASQLAGQFPRQACIKEGAYACREVLGHSLGFGRQGAACVSSQEDNQAAGRGSGRTGLQPAELPFVAAGVGCGEVPSFLRRRQNDRLDDHGVDRLCGEGPIDGRQELDE